VWGLRREGAEVEVWNRTAARASELAGEFGAVAVERFSSREYDLVVNATAVGMAASPTSNGGENDLKALGIDADGIGDRQVVVDLAYGSGETELARTARNSGAIVIDGLEVLVRQGAESFRIWTGLAPPLEAMRRAVRST
jgi:shikimate dehydrogenase